MKQNSTKNLMTECIDCPSRWRIDQRYTWLTPKQREDLDAFPFDFGDILNEAANFAQRDNVAKALGVKRSELEEYCAILWNKPFDLVYQILSLAARNATISNVFAKWANQGNSTAMSIMARGVMRMDDEGTSNEIRVRIVNDLEED